MPRPKVNAPHCWRVEEDWGVGASRGLGGLGVWETRARPAGRAARETWNGQIYIVRRYMLDA